MTKKRSSRTNNNKTQGFRIAIYTRVSTEEQAENPEGSIKNQEMRLREFIKLKNMVEPFGEVAVVYSDPGVSAKDMNRPGFQKMLRAIENHEIELVLVTELSRFSRSTKDFAMLQEFLEEHDCKFMSIRENFDTSGAAGSMVLNLMASIAEFERRQTAERISHSFLARAKRGLYNGGSIPLGYKVEPEKPGTLIIVPEEAELVKLFFSTFLCEQTLAATAKKLNADGIRIPRQVRGGGSVRSKSVRFDQVYRILRNKAYLGIRVYQTKHGSEEVPAVWEPIMDKVTFERVQKMLDHNCSRRKTYNNKYPFTLSGLIYCKECGESMSGTGERFGYYEHLATRKKEASIEVKLLAHKPRRVPAAKIEPKVWDEVKKFILDPNFAKDLLTRAKAMQNETVRETKSKELEGKLKNLDRQIAVLAERIALLPDGIEPKPLIEQLGQMQKNQRKLTEELQAASNELEPNNKIVSLENLDLFRKGLSELITKGELESETRTQIIKLIVHRIEILKDGFEIQFYVGEAHYDIALGSYPCASFFVPFAQIKTPKTKKPSGNFPEGLVTKQKYHANQTFLGVVSSTRLTNGGFGVNQAKTHT